MGIKCGVEKVWLGLVRKERKEGGEGQKSTEGGGEGLVREAAETLTEPHHQVRTAGGLEPREEQRTSYVRPADNGSLGWLIVTSSGRTIITRK
ncbi:hypothetical protein Pmani_033633 [Petrolisthes manimaculis]|uniref:Uncharacterized protein n=1 Tax=Petrolisthes manimaculis TaxID=1843537 RepID=A0AAE1NPB6_9EUCA|nr:hypothetical protein Pmani_033633 [Petrolisthes manimaculis]